MELNGSLGVFPLLVSKESKPSRRETIPAPPTSSETRFSSRGNVLLDLDGTLADPRDGIINAYRYALDKIGRPVCKNDILLRIIGPPLRTTFLEHLGNGTLADEAIDHYRKRFEAQGVYQSVPYAGVVDALHDLHRNYRLFLTSSKLQRFAKQILENLGIMYLFDGIYGSLPDGTYDDKKELISFVLKREYLNPNSSVMVGDRSHDIIGATANNIPCVGAAWGYGGKEELLAAGAALICHSPKDLPKCIDRILSPPPFLP